MAMSDFKIGLITTPPMDRRAVETKITPFEKKFVTDALRSESPLRHCFVVCPYIKYLGALAEKLKAWVPELRIGVAYGGMPRAELDKVMSDFEEGHDVLPSTNIVESGIDIDTANTLFIYCADLFGLSSLYQLRGVGRGKVQVMPIFACKRESAGDMRGKASETALKRLEIMRSLDYLGAGFQVASHDMDLLARATLVGQEQSGHIREVGVTYYQKLLTEAMETLRHKSSEGTQTNVPGCVARIEPEITYPASVYLPGDYVTDLNMRLTLYQRLSLCKEEEEVDDMADEFLDRFGPLPPEALP